MLIIDIREKIPLGILIAGWLFLVSAGLLILCKYENSPGQTLSTPAGWPSGSAIQRQEDKPTLVMFVHPSCPCTRATLEELARLMTRCRDKVSANVLFVVPASEVVNESPMGLWAAAASIPGVLVARDAEGVEARRFHARTSGLTLLYDSHGRLLFSGGITPSRGHEGDNAGRGAVVSLLLHGRAKTDRTFVFGCSLFGNEANLTVPQKI